MAVPARAPLGELTSSTASGLLDLRRALVVAGAEGIPVAPGTRFFFTSTSVRTLAPGCEFGAFSSFVPRDGALPLRHRSMGGIVFVRSAVGQRNVQKKVFAVHGCALGEEDSPTTRLRSSREASPEGRRIAHLCSNERC